MINIVSRSILSKKISGPKQVVDNLILGLNEIGYPFVINQRLDACERLWIHDDIKALHEAEFLNSNIKTIAGPNIFVVPRNIPKDLDLSKIVYIQPSQWVIDFWKYLGFGKNTLDAWPTGIETSYSLPPKSVRETVLIYFKNRFPEELNLVKKILNERNIPYEIIIYGSYEQEDYLDLLKKTKYVIWIGRQESQGIALEEALGMDIPILVWDVTRMDQWVASLKEMSMFNEKENAYGGATSAYYFSEDCGIKIKNDNDLEDTITEMELKWREFTPKKYIEENLSLKKQARDFVYLYEKHFNLSFEEGLMEKQRKFGLWRNARWYYRLYTSLKDSAKTIRKYYSML